MGTPPLCSIFIGEKKAKMETVHNPIESNMILEAVLLFRPSVSHKFYIQLALPISPEIMDGFWCSRCLNDRIEVPDMMRLFAGGATTPLVVKIWTKQPWVKIENLHDFECNFVLFRGIWLWSCYIFKHEIAIKVARISNFSKFKVQSLDIAILLGAEGPQQGAQGPKGPPAGCAGPPALHRS